MRNAKQGVTLNGGRLLKTEKGKYTSTHNAIVATVTAEMQ